MLLDRGEVEDARKVIEEMLRDASVRSNSLRFYLIQAELRLLASKMRMREREWVDHHSVRGTSKTKLSHFARRPNKLIDMKTIRAEVVPGLSSRDTVVALTKFQPKTRAPIVDICKRMGQTEDQVIDKIFYRIPSVWVK